jgi:hypothetical protein
MPLLAFWASQPIAVAQLTIEQIVATAGSGDLKDGSTCSQELREYLSQIPTDKLAGYIDGCLTGHFTKGGMVLQDLVNELGRRLDYKVTNGRYQGTTNAIGNDGLWVWPEGHSIVLEVKTTDAYRISLDKIAAYRAKLVATGQVGPLSSVLIVVGREDTGELEAQVRGSRHAWDMRLISADALIKLVLLKEAADDPATSGKIRSLLAPMEYTRLDALIDVMFTTAKDVEGAADAEIVDVDELPDVDAVSEKPKGAWQFTDRATLEATRERMIAALGQREQTSLIRKSRALYWNASHDVRAAFAISKRYTRKGGPIYWYAYHPSWDEFLAEGQRAFFVLGCMGLKKAFAIPLKIMRGIVDALNTTELEDGKRYWHIHLSEPSANEFSLTLPKRKAALPLKDYEMSLDQ